MAEIKDDGIHEVCKAARGDQERINKRLKALDKKRQALEEKTMRENYLDGIEK